MSQPLAESQSPEPQSRPGVFEVKDCALISIATGKRAWTLKELHDTLSAISLDSVYFHFWGGLLEPRFEEREFNNDFAGWARHGLHDAILAERLAMVDPIDYPQLEELRQELMEVIEERLDESEYLPWVRATRPFLFIRSQIVVFDTHRRLEHPRQLADVLPQLSTGSIFYHFIDARRRLSESIDDFRLWLSGFDSDYGNLCERLRGIDPYFGTLAELRGKLSEIFHQCCPEAHP